MPIKIGAVLPELNNATAWLNADFLNEDLADSFRHQHCVVNFWAKSCPSCKVNMRHLQSLRNRYEEHGLKTVAVHMPRGTFDLNIDEVRAVALELGITEPCAIDNEHIIGDRFEVKAWPTYYLFDKNGLLKRHAAGGFGVRMIEAALKDIFGD